MLNIEARSVAKYADGRFRHCPSETEMLFSLTWPTLAETKPGVFVQKESMSFQMELPCMVG